MKPEDRGAVIVVSICFAVALAILALVIWIDVRGP